MYQDLSPSATWCTTRLTSYYRSGATCSSGVCFPSVAMKLLSTSTRGWSGMCQSWFSALFANGVNRAFSNNTVLWIQDLLTLGVLGDTSTFLDGPSLKGFSFLNDSGNCFSAANVANDGRPFKTHCTQVNKNEALQSFRSSSLLYLCWHCYFCLSLSCLVVVNWCGSLALSVCSDVSDAAPLGKTVALSKDLGARGWHDRMKLKGVRLHDLGTWAVNT